MAWSGPQGPIGNLGYVYDADGRVIQKTGSLAWGALPQPVTANSFNSGNQLVSFNRTPLAYDANGNLINDGSNTYTWDARNRLVGMAGSSVAGGSASFAYDPYARRVSRTINGRTTQFQYD